MITHITKNRLREKISETISHTRHASTKGARHVFQREDAAVLSNRTGYWTFDLSDEVLQANEGDAPILGAKPTPIREARERILQALQEEHRSLTRNLD